MVSTMRIPQTGPWAYATGLGRGSRTLSGRDDVGPDAGARGHRPDPCRRDGYAKAEQIGADPTGERGSKTPGSMPR